MEGGEKKCQVKQDKVERKEEKKRRKSQKGNDDFAKRKREGERENNKRWTRWCLGMLSQRDPGDGVTARNSGMCCRMRYKGRGMRKLSLDPMSTMLREKRTFCLQYSVQSRAGVLLPECWWFFQTQNPCTRVLRGQKTGGHTFCRSGSERKSFLGGVCSSLLALGEASSGSAVPCLSYYSFCLLSSFLVVMDSVWTVLR